MSTAKVGYVIQGEAKLVMCYSFARSLAIVTDPRKETNQVFIFIFIFILCDEGRKHKVHQKGNTLYRIH